MKLASFKNYCFIAILIAIIIGCFCLGIWQVGRYSEKQQLNNTPSASAEVSISALTAANAEQHFGNTVTLEGEFLTESTFKLDNRMFKSSYGVEIYSLLRESATGRVFLVNMGWLEVDNRRDRLDSRFDFSSIHDLQAMVARIPSKPPFVDTANFRDDNRTDLWLFVNREYLEEKHSVSIEPLVLVNMAPQSGLEYIEIVKKDDAYMHILYAIQWFLFSLFALFGLIKIYK